MLVRVNIATESGGQTYLVDTEDIENDNVREAVEYMVEKDPKEMGRKQFGEYITVAWGEIVQEGYVASNALHEVALDEDVPQVSVVTSI